MNEWAAVDTVHPAKDAFLVQPSDKPAAPPLGKTKFETQLQVRPDDIDMNQHVHGSRYFDYILAARYDQMARCYKMPMEEFIAAGYGWFTKTTYIEFKRPLRLGEQFIVRTWVDAMLRSEVKVQFQIDRTRDGKRCAEGYCDYTMVSLKTGRAEPIPERIIANYTI